MYEIARRGFNEKNKILDKKNPDSQCLNQLIHGRMTIDIALVSQLYNFNHVVIPFCIVTWVFAEDRRRNSRPKMQSHDHDQGPGQTKNPKCKRVSKPSFSISSWKKRWQVQRRPTSKSESFRDSTTHCRYQIWKSSSGQFQYHEARKTDGTEGK